MSAPDWRELSEAIDHTIEGGGRVPCREGGLAHSRAWISAEPSAQRHAAAACGDCTAVAMCREYAVANPLEAGVLGGLTELDRKPLRGRPKTSARNQGGGSQ